MTQSFCMLDDSYSLAFKISHGPFIYNLNGVYHDKPCENKLHVTGKWKSQNLNSKAHSYSLKICAFYYTKIFYWRQACFVML